MNTTIEHILPKDKSDTAWNNFTPAEHEEYLHTIGNLCLLSPNLNSEASKKSFTHKKQIYDRVSLISLQQVKEHKSWTKMPSKIEVQI
ncbi:MAG: HNH endonuclease [Methylococcales bacterium]|nr:HNH endonuclease [Methylococcales bacterium]